MTKFWRISLLTLGIVLFSGASMAQNSCETDLNGDGVTDEADVAIFQSALGKAAGDEGFIAAADLDGDGAVTPSDYSIFLACN